MNMQEEKKVVMNIPYFQVPNSIFDFDFKIKVKEYTGIGEKGETKTIIRPLRGTEKIVYIYLCRCGNQGSAIFPTYETIAEKCGISVRKAKEAIEILVNNGLVSKENRILKSNIYVVKSPEEIFKR